MNIVRTSQFKRDYKRHENNRKEVALIKNTIALLVSGAPLPPEYLEHQLRFEYKGCTECHIRPDLLLIYERTAEKLVLYRLGSHSETLDKPKR